jgi:hypothetical protein
MRLLALAAASACAASSLAAARPDADVTVTADLGGAPTWASFFMLDCVGASHGEMYMWEDNRNHLRAIARDIGFRHVRGHGLLDDDMSSYICYWTNHHSEQICFTSWANIHSVFDFYLSVNIRPIFEISGMPSFLAWNQQSPSHVMWYRFGNMQPGNDTAWGLFIEDLFTDLVARYGVDELRSWRIEVCRSGRGVSGRVGSATWSTTFRDARSALSFGDAGLATARAHGRCVGSGLGDSTD